MPQHQEKTKQRRAREIENTKRRREQELQKKQQQQPPARSTQPQQPAQRATQQPARQPAVVLPDYTERATKLGDLIALYLRGNWNWNDGMQMARQYAPNGTTEAELRAAVMHAAKVQGNTGNLYLRALVQPEVVHPEVDISDLPKQSTLQNVARGLQAPVRSMAAIATQQAGKRNPRGQYGKESGGKPFPAPQSFAESYASDPTFGSALELAFPDTPQWFRVLLGGALDLALDPTGWLGYAPIKRGVSTLGKTVSNTRAVQKVAEPVKNVAGAVGTRVMHPTAAKQVAKQLPKTERTKALSELGKALEQIPVYSFTRNVGTEMLDFRNKLDNIIQRANAQGINIPQSHRLLDFEKYLDDLKLKTDRVVNKLNNMLVSDLDELAELETVLRGVGSEPAKELANELAQLRNKVFQQSDNWFRFGKLIDDRFSSNKNILNNDAISEAMWEGARAVYRREILPRNTLINRAIDFWKRTKTVWNPATHTRNFFQNFLYRYLTGDVDVLDLPLMGKSLGDMMRLRRIIDDLASRGNNINIDDIIEQYPDLLQLAGTFSLERKKPIFRRTTQPVVPGVSLEVAPDEWLRLDSILSIPDEQLRKDLLREALSEYIPKTSDVIRAGTLPQEAGIPISQLPRNWGDVLLFLPRRIRDVWREAKADKRSGVGAISQRAYQGEDVLPALLMESAIRRKAIKAQKPDILSGRSFRMDYSSIPETIGLLNIAALPFFSYQYLAMKGLQQALRRNPERIYNIIVKPIERSTRITQADDEQGVSQAPRFGFKEREMFPVSPTRGVPYSGILPIDPQFAEPFFSLSGWVSRSPLTAIARPFVENRDDSVRLVEQLIREITPATYQHLAYAILGEPQRGMQPVLQHTRGERLLRALGINIQPIDQMRIARQQQRQAEQQRREPLYDDPATITDFVKRILRGLGW